MKVYTWLPFPTWFYEELALALMHSGLASVSVSVYLSVIGMFAEMLGYTRPAASWISYAVKGLSAASGPPPKHHVLVFPYEPAILYLDLACQFEGLTL